MTFSFGFHPGARAEFAADIAWYDTREVAVGARFERAVREAVDAAVDSPESWAQWPDWDREPVVRSKRVPEFPHRVIYFVDGELVMIVAIAHSKRRPGFWRDRM